MPSNNPLSVEPITGTIICIACGVGVALGKAVDKHLKKNHAADPEQRRAYAREVEAVRRDVLAVDNVMRDVYLNAPVEPTEGVRGRPLQPLVGLLVVDGYECPRCLQCFKVSKNIAGHGVAKHLISTEDAQTFVNEVVDGGVVKIQTLLQGSKLRYFRVASVGPDGGRSGGVKDKDGDVEEHLKDTLGGGGGVDMAEECENPMEVHDDLHHVGVVGGEAEENVQSMVHGMLEAEDSLMGMEDGNLGQLSSDFLAKWEADKVLAERELSMTDAVGLAASPDQKDGLEMVVHEDAVRYLEHAGVARGQVAPSVLHQMALKEDAVFEVVRGTSVRKYARVMGALVLFGKRLVEMVGSVEEAVGTPLGLYVGLCEQAVGEGGGDGGRDVGDMGERDRALHAVLKSILLQRRKMWESTDKLFVKLFLACSSVGERLGNVRFREAEEVSPTLAALQYSTSSVGIMEVVEMGKRHGEGAVEEDGDEEMRGLVARMDKHQNNAGAYIRNMLNSAMNLIKLHSSEVCFVECNRHPFCGFVEGRELSLETLGKAVREWQGKAEELMMSEVLFGLEIPPTWRDELMGIQDNMSRKEAGFCFLKHRGNSDWMKRMADMVLGHMQTSSKARAALGCLKKRCSDGRGEASSVSGTGTGTGTGTRGGGVCLEEEEQGAGNILNIGQLVCSVEKARKWLSVCQELQELLLVMLHVSGGSPARATEMCALNFQNSTTAMRNLFVSQGEVVLVAKYSKIRAMRGGDRMIPRFPDETTSRLLLTYFILVRPLEASVSRIAHGDKERGKVHLLALFNRNGVRYDGDAMREVIRKRLNHAKIGYGVNQFRHYTAAMVRLVTRVDDQWTREIVEEFQAIAHKQAGHSVAVADRVYGRSHGDQIGVGFTQLRRYRAWCQIWHKHLGLSSSYGNTGCVKGVVVAGDGTSVADVKDGDGGVGGRLMKSYIDSIGEQVSARLEASVSKSLKRVRDEEDDEMLEDDNSNRWEEAEGGGKKEDRRKRMKENTMWPRGSQRSEGNMDDGGGGGGGGVVAVGQEGKIVEAAPRMSLDGDVELFLGELRRMFSNKHACFKSQMQADVVARVKEAQTDMVVSMPTGAGKSLCFLLPAFMEKGKGSTIVIVPLFALRMDLHHRCKEYGLVVRGWKSRDTAKHGFGDVYLFSAEHVDMAGFHTLATELYAHRLLKRIVVDEAHLTWMWSDFRPALRNVEHALRSLEVHVPRVLFSSTIPPKDVLKVMSMHGLTYGSIHRTSALRLKLRIAVEHVGTERFCTRLQSMCEALWRVLVGTVTKYRRRGAAEATAGGGFGGGGRGGGGGGGGDGGNGLRLLVYAQRIYDVEHVKDFLLKRGGRYGEEQQQHQMSSSDVVLFEDGDVLSYHGKMTDNDMTKAYSAWKKELSRGNREVRVMVCTNAFGTGIDAKLVRGVFHFGGSNSLIDYAQEIGRAGREGTEADCIVIYSAEEAQSFQRMLHRRLYGGNGNGDAEGMRGGSSSAPLDKWMLCKHSNFLQFRTWAEANRHCRKNRLYELLDGKAPGLCLYNSDSVNCDVCERRSGGSGGDGQDDCLKMTGDGSGGRREFRVTGRATEGACHTPLSSTPRRCVTSGGSPPQPPPPYAGGVISRGGGGGGDGVGIGKTLRVVERGATGYGVDTFCRGREVARVLEFGGGRGRGGGGEAEGKVKAEKAVRRTPTGGRYSPGCDRSTSTWTGTTMARNAMVNQERTEVAKEALEQFVAIAESLKGICVVCVVREGGLQEGTGCRVMRKCRCEAFLCGRCFGPNHVRSKCPVNCVLHGLCYQCGFGRVFGIIVHEYGFGKPTCPLRQTHYLCCQLWYCAWREDVVLKRFMRSRQDGTYLYETPKKERTGHEVMSEFFAFLNQKVHGAPMRLVLVLVWAAEANFADISTNVTKYLTSLVYSTITDGMA